jgi:hypothetical protein
VRFPKTWFLPVCYTPTFLTLPNFQCETLLSSRSFDMICYCRPVKSFESAPDMIIFSEKVFEMDLYSRYPKRIARLEINQKLGR